MSTTKDAKVTKNSFYFVFFEPFVVQTNFVSFVVRFWVVLSPMAC